MKTTDFILRELKKLGIKHVFGITGGAISNQLDAFSRSDIKFITTQHEQAAAMAADGYSRMNGYGVCMVTSGPGGTNTLTGVASSWFDSIPVLIITGQVSTFDLRTNKVRQRGFQEVDMVEAMSPFVKYSRLITNPKDVPDILEEAVRISLEGRPGPVHLDIPMDIQQADIKGRSLNFFPKKKKVKLNLNRVMKLISRAKRPVLIVGNGCRHCLNDLNTLCYQLEWPVLPSWGMVDFDNPYVIDQFGVYGNRGANFTVQNSDLILSIGCRLDTRMTGSKPKLFAREAKRIIVDIDRNELHKGVVNPDIAICADSKDFIKSMLNCKFGNPPIDWWELCNKWAYTYRIKSIKSKMINPYSFLETLSNECEADVVIADTGANMSQVYQMLKPKRLFTALGNSPMGYSICAGMATGLLGYDTVAIIGDGGIQMNIQEFQTIKNYDIPLKIFIFSNEGYNLIRQFQDLYMGGRYVGTHEGVPDFEKVANAYGLKAITISDPKKMDRQIREALKQRQIIVNVIIDPKSIVTPRAIFGKPIEEQHPYLPDKELLSNLIVKRWTP